MKITVEFDSLEEMQQFCDGVAVGPALTKKTETVQEEKAPKKKSRPAKEDPVQEEPEQQQEEPAVGDTPEYTLEDVRSRLGALQKAGKRDEVKKLLQSVGAEKLPEVDPKDYAVLMQKAGELDA